MNWSAFLSILIRVANPIALAGGALVYALGGGIANYLGLTIDWPIYWIGQCIVSFLQVSVGYLKEYFDRAGQPPFAFQPEPGRADPPRVAFLQIAVTSLTICAVLTVLLLANGALSPEAMLILVVAFGLSVAYAMPPARLAYSGYGELALSILQANLFPALAFLLQSGEFHRLLALLTFPLTFLYLATALAQSIEPYMDHLRKERQTMMVRLGWQRGMNLHNLLIAVAYLLMAGSFFAGLPWRLAFPAFLSLPVGLFQVWQINSIANGGKPRWRVLSITALATLAFAIYFMNLALWTG